MTYPFIPAPDHWPRTAPIRAIVIHMAEGGGTVSWLQRPDGNSSHYVVEYTGRIVQMVREDRAAGSINPREIRRTDDPPFTYFGESITFGATAAVTALGGYWSNPNAAVIAIETEGFARTGPNAAERGSLRTLVADIRTRHPGLPVLGHRDFQDYKACPGHLIPWADYGGHGAPTEDDVPDLNYGAERWTLDGATPVTSIGGPRLPDGSTDPDTRYVLFSGKAGDKPWTVQPVERARLEPLANDLSDDFWLALTGYKLAEPPTADCGDEVAAAREKDHAAVLAAVEEVYP